MTLFAMINVYRIRTKFLFGADVGRSQIAMSTNATMLEEPPKGPKGLLVPS